MPTENPIALHPELTKPVDQDTRESAISRAAKARPFYTANLTRDEYEELKGDYASLGSDLLARTVFGGGDWYRAIGRDFDRLNSATKELIFWFLQERVEGSVLFRAVGDDWKLRAERYDVLLPTPLQENNTEVREERRRLLSKPFVESGSRFQWDFIGMQQDQAERYASTFVLSKGAFTEEEMREIVRRAIKDYQLLNFGAEHFYDIAFAAYSFWHYRDAYLDVIGRLAPGRLPSDEIPDEIRTVAPLGFSPTHIKGVEYLAVEDLETSRRLRVYNLDRSTIDSGEYTWGEPLWVRRTDVNYPDAKLLSVGI